jgi:two-component system, NarL family, response regulator
MDTPSDQRIAARVREWVGVVDDHPLFRAGLVQCIEGAPGLGVAWTAREPAEAMAKLSTSSTDFLITDVYFAGQPLGIELAAQAIKRWPALKVVVMSAFVDEAASALATFNGAVAVLDKDRPGDEVVQLLRSLRGRRELRSVEALSRRELEVLAEMRKGRTNREIAFTLGISTATVNKHVHQTLRKLRVRNRAQAVAISQLR